jgi:hypothetical protein
LTKTQIWLQNPCAEQIKVHNHVKISEQCNQ